MYEPGSILLYGVGTYISQGGTTTEKFGTGNANTTDNDKFQTWRIAPGVGYNITDNIAIGLDGFYGNTKTTIDRQNMTSFPGTDQYKTFNWGVGPFARYTCPLSQHFFAYGQGGAHYLNGRRTTRTVTAQSGGTSYVKDDNYKGFDISFVPAVGAMLTKTLGLTFSVGGVSYQYQKWDYSTQGRAPGSNKESKENNFNISFGREVSFGIQKYFGCSKMHRGHHAEPMDDTRHMDTSDDEEGNSKRHKHKHDDE
jgi:hypothetical protein